MKNSFFMTPEGMNDTDVWTRIYEAKTYGTVVPAKIVRRKEIQGQGGAWELEFPEIPGVTGLVPESQNGLPEGTPMSALVGSIINVKILGVDRQEGIAACSRKEAVDVSIAKLMSAVVVGDEIPAVVKFIRNRNMYLDIGGGIILRIPSEKARLSHGVPVDAQYSQGDIVEVVVTEMDRIEKNITVEFSSPWTKWALSRGEILMGTVVTIRDKLAFIRVKPGIVGLVSYNAWDYFQIGDELMFQVNACTPQNRKLHLTMWNPEKAKKRRRAMAIAKGRNMNQKVIVNN
ncbi:MAG: RNA-binding protein [Peptococcaceae bacterium]|nr:RNA-binding protein [Peptococcaceae bacterium]